MGIDIHALNFLRYAKNRKLLGNTITIGRQGLHVIEPMVKKLIGTTSIYKNQTYCEELLTDYFGATKVDSLDNSDFEKATYIHDMNEPLPKSLCGRYDTVIDGGSLEHIYNAPQALKSCSLLCKPKGQILHVLPTNNYCGHGFWQFSPELFFSLYSEANGYSETEVFVADLSDTDKWFRVKQPSNGKRVHVSSSTELYVLVRTVLKSRDFSHSDVQQSDYVFEWNNKNVAERQPHVIKKALKRMPLVYMTLLQLYRHHLRSKTRLNGKNPGLAVIDVKSFI